MPMSVDIPNRPQFPIRLVWCETGEIETYDDEIDLLQNLEDFDSNEPSDRNAATVTDALGRPVNLVVRIYDDLCEFSLDQRHP